MMIVVLISVVELVIILYQRIVTPSELLLDVKDMLSIFGFFLMVLIGLELMESVKAFLEEDKIHAEIVFLVAIVAVARKIIILDYKEITPDFLYGMAAIIVALSTGYFLVKKGVLIKGSGSK